MKKIIKLVSFLLLSLLVLYGCELSSNDESNIDNNLYVLTEMNSNRGNTGYKKGDITSYSIDLNSELIYVNEFTEDGFGPDAKEDNTYDLENLEENEESLSFTFDNREEILLKKSESVYESQITGIQYQFQEDDINLNSE
jgi:hypothetical protein